LNQKFSKELRLCLGIAAVSVDGTSIAGRKCQLFEYSEQKFVSDEEFDDIMAKEIRRVKGLKKKSCKPWVQKNYEPSTVYKSDLVIVLKNHDNQKFLKGIGQKTIKKLMTKNVRTIGDMIEHRGQYECSVLTKLNKVLDLLTIKEKHINRIDHRQSDNPYASLYGTNWKLEIKKATMVQKYVTISEMVKHIYYESRRLMQGTKYSDNWFFYHDALSLMTLKTCKAWMEKEGI
jgi:hypothetical protein